MIGLALPELKLPYFAELADSVIVEAQRQGLRVIIEQTNANRTREIEVLLNQGRSMVDGLIFSPLALGQEDIHLVQVGYPLVLLGERVFEPTNDHVTMSNVEAVRAATRHLIGSGRRRIALVGAHPGETVGSAILREQGYREALAEAGLPLDEELVVSAGMWRRSTGAAATDHLIGSGVDFDAIFALNDAMAIGALHSLHAHGRDVPSDVAVVGFDDIEDASYTSPTLTTVDPGREQIAREAVALLQHRMSESGRPATERTPIRRIIADYQLRVRESSAS